LRVPFPYDLHQEVGSQAEEGAVADAGLEEADPHVLVPHQEVGSDVEGVDEAVAVAVLRAEGAEHEEVTLPVPSPQSHAVPPLAFQKFPEPRRSHLPPATQHRQGGHESYRHLPSVCNRHFATYDHDPQYSPPCFVV
jgi:hypothetical protein